MCVGLSLGFLSCSIDLYFCFCANTKLSWLLKLCNIVWSWGAWFPQLHFFPLKIALVIQGLLCFHTNFKIICSNTVKNAIGNLIRIALNLWIALSSVVILTILSFSTQKMVYLSICLCYLQFLSSVSYSFCIQVFCLLREVYS